jgi:magnesium-transporting ATPase (P-type)
MVTPIMATGDNPLTATSVSYSCEILSMSRYYLIEFDSNHQLWFYYKDAHENLDSKVAKSRLDGNNYVPQHDLYEESDESDYLLKSDRVRLEIS